jgi:hypothetical protein
MKSISSASSGTASEDAALPPNVRRDRATRALVAALEQFVAECVAGATPTFPEWVDQDASPLGRRRHLAAVRRGHLVGCKVGKRVLVRRADLNSYLEKQTVVVVPQAGDASDEVDPYRVAEVAAEVLASVGLRPRKGK